MTTSTIFISKFQQLPLEDKKAKVLAFIAASALEQTNPVFTQLRQQLESKSPYVDDDFCIGVYTDIVELATQVDQINKKQQFSSIQDKLNNIQQREQEERKQENADNILNKLDAEESSPLQNSKKRKVVTILIGISILGIGGYYSGYVDKILELLK